MESAIVERAHGTLYSRMPDLGHVFAWYWLAVDARKYALKKPCETMKDAGPDKGRVLLSVWDAEGMRAYGWFA